MLPYHFKIRRWGDFVPPHPPSRRGILPLLHLPLLSVRKRPVRPLPHLQPFAGCLAGCLRQPASQQKNYASRRCWLARKEALARSLRLLSLLPTSTSSRSGLRRSVRLLRNLTRLRTAEASPQPFHSLTHSPQPLRGWGSFVRSFRTKVRLSLARSLALSPFGA